VLVRRRKDKSETLWDDAYLALGAQGPAARELQELVSLWSQLTAERQHRVLEFVRDQGELSRIELAAEYATGKHELGIVETEEGAR